jgi:thiol:disulfide interchange protein DsbD
MDGLFIVNTSIPMLSNPTQVVFDNPKSIKLIGKNKEGGHIKTMYDEIWDAKITKFTETAILKQRIKVLDDSKPISGYVNFQTCDATKCLPQWTMTFPLI